jgi:hypothetical protein
MNQSHVITPGYQAASRIVRHCKDVIPIEGERSTRLTERFGAQRVNVYSFVYLFLFHPRGFIPQDAFID